MQSRLNISCTYLQEILNIIKKSLLECLNALRTHVDIPLYCIKYILYVFFDQHFKGKYINCVVKLNFAHTCFDHICT